MKNKKGFTLIELLAVIVILAVVMLIAATAVIPMMTKSRQNALLDEGFALEKAAKLAYQDPMNSDYVGKKVCITMKWLNSNNFYEKGTGVGSGNDGYIGSVLINPTNPSTGAFTTTFWITNSNYVFGATKSDNTLTYTAGASASTKYTDAQTFVSTDTDMIAKLQNCGGNTGIVKTWS